MENRNVTTTQGMESKRHFSQHMAQRYRITEIGLNRNADQSR